MYLKALKLINFKNYKNLDIEFNDKCNVISGKNAQGKTNLIEAIYFLSTLSFFRNIDNSDIIQFGENFSYIKGSVSFNSIEKEYQVNIDKEKKIIKINNKNIFKIKEYFGGFYCVAYIPSNITLIESYPSLRRKYFDRTIFNKKISFLDLVKKYNKIVEERNFLLKNKVYGNSFDIYTNLLIQEGSKYIKERLLFIGEFNEILTQTYNGLKYSDFEKPFIKYKCVNKNEDENFDIGQIEEIMLSKYRELKNQEKIRGKTLFGPHLDDFEFYIDNNKSLKNVASQGQKKSFLLTLKLTELELLKEIEPIFLIDDFTSELDEKRRELLLNYINLNSNQSFITTTNINNLPIKDFMIYNKYVVDNGKVIC